jgi:hypothetical protein
MGSILDRTKRFYFLRNVQEGYGTHPTSSTMGTGEPFLVGKAELGLKLITHLHLVLRSIMVEL